MNPLRPYRWYLRFACILLCGLISFSSYSQVVFHQIYGGQQFDEAAAIVQTADEGFAVVGTTSSFEAQEKDLFLMRTSVHGEILWTKTFGSFGDEEGTSILLLRDGGFLLGGVTNSSGSGKKDIYLVRTDENGNKLWSKTYGGPEDDRCVHLSPSYDGGFLALGETKSFGSGNSDVYLIKVDQQGVLDWSATYGTDADERGYDLSRNGAGGYLITGEIEGGFGAGRTDVLAVNISSSGALLWDKSYGGQQSEGFRAMARNGKNGYWLTGFETEFGAATGNASLSYLDEKGNLMWARSYGTTGAEMAHAAAATADGGVIIAGTTTPFGQSNSNCFIIKIDFTGDTLWTRSFGGEGTDLPVSIVQTTDGGYMMVGNTTGFGAENQDVFLLKFDGNGNCGCNQHPIFPRVRTLNLFEGSGIQASSGGTSNDITDKVSFGNNLASIICSSKPPENKPYKVRIGEINCQIVQPGRTICYGETLDLSVDTTINYSLDFDGKSYVNCGRSNRFAFDGNDFSFAAWVKPSSIEGRKTVLFKHSSASARHGLYHLYLQNGYPTFTVMNAARSKYIYTSSAAKLVPGEWSHLAVIANSEDRKIRLFVNGREMASSTWKSKEEDLESSDHVISTDEFLIGATFQTLADGNLGYGSFFEGNIDQVSFWNLALDQFELPIKAIEPLACYVEPGLIGYWNFNEGFGDKGFDAGIENNHARIFGAGFSEDVPFDQHKPNYKYNWSTGSAQAYVQTIPKKTTTYYVTATDGDRVGVDSVVIQVSKINTGAIAGINRVVNDQAATYSVPSHPQSRYRWLVEGAEIMAGGNSHTVTVQVDKPKEFSVSVVEINSQGCTGDTIRLGELPIYDGYILRNINFERNSAVLKPESRPELDKLAKVLLRYTSKCIELQGHTDFVGVDAGYLQRLSERRARTVAEYLVSKGVSKERVSYKGFGGDKPIAPNDTEEGRQLNRRVEIRVIDDCK